MQTRSQAPAISARPKQFSGTFSGVSLSRGAIKANAWVDQDAVGWFYLAAFLFVILPYLIMRAKAWAKGAPWPDISAERLDRRPRLPR